MNIDFTKNSHRFFFGLVLSALSIFLAWLFSLFFTNPPFWLETLSPLVAYGLLFSLFNKYLWHLKIFRVLDIVTFPDLRGEWRGVIRSSYKISGKNVTLEAHLEIRQYFSNIYISGTFEKSNSESGVAIFKEINKKVYLYYTYDNDPNSLKAGGMQMHRGTVKLLYSKEDNKLIGSYFNNIGNQGEIELKFEKDYFI